MRTYRVCAIAVLGAVCLATAPEAAAQAAAPGTIQGRVTLEPGGEPVHGALLVLVGGRRTATTGDDGRYEIANVPAGRYEVLVQREHFSAPRQTVDVVAGQRVTLDFKLALATVHENLTVTASATGTASAFESFNAVTTLDSFEIIKKIGPTLADVLQDEPGIAKRTFGPGSSRPIIRGFDGDRVLIMQDGVRTGDLSSQSGDHGVSIDPAGLSRIEVVKGPATLLYGSNALGGVVNAVTPQDVFRTAPFAGTFTGVTFDAGSANAQAGVSANVQRGRGPLLLYGSLTSRRTGDYDAPGATIENSATRLLTAEGGFNWTGARGYVGVGVGLERNRYGVPFAGQFEGEDDAQIDLDVARQSLRVDFGGRNLSGRFADAIRATASLLDYRHDEVEIEDGEEALGTRFTNRVFSLRAEVEQKRSGRLGGRMGAEFFTRAYEAIGEEALAPATDHRSFALFVYEELSFARQRLQFGGRYEYNGYSSDVSRSFNGVSGSIGWHRSIGSGGAFVANLIGASRAPALEELFNYGPHLGNLLFEVGNDALTMERTVGFDASLRGRSGRLSGEFNAYVYSISDFVFQDVTDDVEDGLPVAYYNQGDSRFSGFEMLGRFEASQRVGVYGAMGLVKARLTQTDEALPRIPPVHGKIGMTATFGAFTITPEVVMTAMQSDVFRAETPTDGWATLSVNASWQRLTAHGTHLVTVQAYNLTNTEYRLHTSFIKDLAPEMGRGIKVSYSMRVF